MNDIFTRTGSFEVRFSKKKIFPLLCPKTEEKWIPGWRCDVVYSISGVNEPGAVFHTPEAFGTELIWVTQTYNPETGKVEFTNFAPEAFIFNFFIKVEELAENLCRLTFTHEFKLIGAKGIELIETYRAEDFAARLNGLGKRMEKYLSELL
jgi:hypothetical protein